MILDPRPFLSDDQRARMKMPTEPATVRPRCPRRALQSRPASPLNRVLMVAPPSSLDVVGALPPAIRSDSVHRGDSTSEGCNHGRAKGSRVRASGRAVEQAVAEIQPRLDTVPNSDNWLGRVIGSIRDVEPLRRPSRTAANFAIRIVLPMQTMKSPDVPLRHRSHQHPPRRSGPDYATLAARVARHSPADMAYSIVSFHEQVLGAQTFINRASDHRRGRRRLYLARGEPPGVRPGPRPAVRCGRRRLFDDLRAQAFGSRRWISESPRSPCIGALSF